MVRSYFRHGPTRFFGIICSASSNSQYDGKLAYVPALEDVIVWDMKKGEMLALWHESGHEAEVTCLLRSPNEDCLAVGYADGSIRLWNLSSNTVTITFNGHKKSVTALAFNDQGTCLISGSQDTELIVWDIVAEAGLFRLRGHRDQITAARFLTSSVLSYAPTSISSGFLLTSSKDTFLKLWDLSNQHCIQTLVAHRSEIWSMDVNKERDLVLTGSGEGDIKVWRIDRDALAGGLTGNGTEEAAKMIHPFASLPVTSRHRVSQITFHPSEPYLAVQSHDRSIEIFRIRTPEDIRKKQLRRKKRKEKRGQLTEEEKESSECTAEVQLTDMFTPHIVVRAKGKIRSFDFCNGFVSKKTLQIFTALASNALEVYNIPLADKSQRDLEVTRVFSVDLPGHRTDVRTLSLSSDDRILASASNGSLKLWNMKTNACIRTMECSYAVCSAFLPGDRYIAVGTKSGEILVYELTSSTLVESAPAHAGTVWSLHVRADQQALASGGADKEVRFWEIGEQSSAAEGVQSKKSLSLVHIRTLKMTDDVLSVKYSADRKLLAVALLDSTVKVFYENTLKFYLSLYGHKLPVLSMDISYDSKLIVTCSADKNVKIWGLDFGDCHKSIFAHSESVMQVAFERGSHYFWTVGKDKLLKYWDGDKFENIQTLGGHHSEIWALALSHYGKFVVTASHDKSIRVWEKLEEPLFLEEERERELEALYETGIADSIDRVDAPIGIGVAGDQDITGRPEAATVTKQTTETLMAGERIIEAINLADNERVRFQEYDSYLFKLAEGGEMKLQPPLRNPVLAACDLEPDEYVLQVIERIPSTFLHDALSVLPFSKVVSLMYYLNAWARKDINIVFVSRIVFFLLRTHHHQIVANRVMRTILIPLQRHLRLSLERQKDVIGYNLAALRYMRKRNDVDRMAQFYDKEYSDEKELRSHLNDSKKRKRVELRTNV